MTEHSRRRARFEIETQVIYRVETPPGPLPPKEAKGVCARNLSENGLLLEAEEYLPPGTRLNLLLIQGTRGAIEGKGEVAWAEDASPKPGLRHGVRITHMEAAQQVAWKLFLEEASREIGRRPLRFDIDLPLVCRRADREETCGGRAVNVSRGGFLVLLPVRFPVDTVLSLEVRTPAQSLKADTRVVRVEDPGADGLIPHGLAFVDSKEGSHLPSALFLLGLL